MMGRWPIAAVALLLLSPLPLVAQGADAVERFVPGSGQNAGQGPEYFPANVLGLPDTTARAWLAATDPAQILSLGLGGEIVLRFDATMIVDRPGVDFTVFENAFVYSIGGRERVYAEPAEVAVSRDGVTFVAFPFDSLTLQGCAGVTPVHGDRDPHDPLVSGGDGFDLATIGMDSVRWVRIRDVTAIVRSNRQHPNYDPTLSGFDLDAVVATRATVATRRLEHAAVDGVEIGVLGANPTSGRTALQIELSEPTALLLTVADVLGRTLHVAADAIFPTGRHRIGIDATRLPSGSYRLIVAADGRVVTSLPLFILR